MRPTNLRFRLVLWFLCIETVTLLCFSLLLYELLSRSLYSHHDEALIATRRRLLADLQPFFNQGGTLAAIPDQYAADQGVEIVSAEGKILVVTPKFQRMAAVLPLERYQNLKEALFLTAEASPKRAVRFLVTPLSGGRLFLIQASDLGDIAHTMRSLKLILGGLIPIVLISTSLGGYVIASRALKPVQRITEQTREIQVKNLDRLLEVETSDVELRALVDTLNGMMRRLAAAFHGTQQFTADASHEMKTPLTILSGTLEVALTQDRSIDEYKETLQTALEEVRKMARMVHELLLLSSLDSGGTVKREEVHLAALCRRVFEMYEPLLEDKGIAAILRIEQEANIHGDPNRISQVLTNLLENALRYTPAGGKIVLTVNRSEENAEVRVSDTGRGIPADCIPHIFGRFYRVEKAGPREDSGVGLGLAIVKRIVETHHGSISVQSREGSGTEFTMSFPILKSSTSDNMENA